MSWVVSRHEESWKPLIRNCAHPGDLPPVAPSENVDQATLQAFQALGRVFHLHRQAMQRRLTTSGAHHGELIILRLLSQNDGMSQSELAETLHLSRPRITGILQGLERSGSVTRESDAGDQRITRVFLTPEGRERELENRAAFEEYVGETIGALSDADKLELERLLNEVSGRIAALLCVGAHEDKAHGTS